MPIKTTQVTSATSFKEQLQPLNMILWCYPIIKISISQKISGKNHPLLSSWGLTGSLSELQAAHVLCQSVGVGARHGGASGHGARRPLSRHFHCGPQQIDLLTVHILHVVLREEGRRTREREGDWISDPKWNKSAYLHTRNVKHQIISIKQWPEKTCLVLRSIRHIKLQPHKT